MNKLYIVAIIAVAVLSVFGIAYMCDNSGDAETFCVLSGSSELDDAVHIIKTSSNYEGYDNDTLKWMESLGNKKVFHGDEEIIIMDYYDAGKISGSMDVTDAEIYNYFTARIVECHDLGENCPDVYYVKNVEFTGQKNRWKQSCLTFKL